MKAFLFLLTTVLLQACNRPIKTPDPTSAPEDEPLSNVCTPATDTTDTINPVYSAEDEARIKKDSLARVRKMFPYMAKYSFEQYKAPLFSGEPADPDFKGNPYADDQEYVDVITKGCKRGINFGGHYTIIEKSCGVFCEYILMVDRKTGKVVLRTGLEKKNGYYGFKYEKNSYLLIANSTATIDGTSDELGVKPEIFKWKGNAFIRLE